MDLKGTPYWNIYGEVFQFFKNALPVHCDQSYWDYILKKGDLITQKYMNTPYYDFAIAQIAAVIGELERLSNKKN